MCTPTGLQPLCCGQQVGGRGGGGAGPPLQFLGGQTASVSVPTGTHCTNYRAETEALLQAASMSQDSNDQCQQVVFLSDALSPGSPPEQQTLFLNKILQHDA